MSLLLAAVVTSTPAYDLDWRVDGPVIATAGVVAFGWTLSRELAPPHCAPACDRGDVFALDRFAAGRYSRGWRTVSDVSLLSGYGLAVGALLLDQGLSAGLQDTVVVGESILVANALAIVANMGVRRPRPLAYGTRAPESERLVGNASLSFFSGHTAGAFAAAVSLFMTLDRHHPDSALRYVALAIGLGAASFIGVTRVAAGDHFPTDVLAGALVGSGMGLLIPTLHGSPVALSAGDGTVALSIALE